MSGNFNGTFEKYSEYSSFLGNIEKERSLEDLEQRIPEM